LFLLPFQMSLNCHSIFKSRWNKKSLLHFLTPQKNTMASDAIGQDRASRVVGYNLKKGNFLKASPNLPMRIAIFAEANHVNQATLNQAAKEITSAKQAGELYGYGSPIHMIMRILRPFSGEGVGGIPTIVYPQAEAGGASERIVEIIVTGTPTANGTHYIKIGGRPGVDGELYAIAITTDDTAATIHQKIEDAINNVNGCPMTAQHIGGYEVDLTTKWKGKTAQGVSVSVDTGENALGLTYTINNVKTGAGVPSIANALSQFGNIWNTFVINGYGTETPIMDALQVFNGIPLDINPTGRYGGTTWKPFIALTGSVADDPSAITDARDSDVTIAICPAPLSEGLHFEAAANVAYLAALTAQNNPHLDVAGQSMPDMPVPVSIGSMAEFNNRDSFVKKGCSTVDLVSGKYQIQDFVTTYHPAGEVPPQYRYVRNLFIDMNVRYGYFLLEQAYVVDHAIANDNDIVNAQKVVKPKQWKSILTNFAADLAVRALTVEPDFMTTSLLVNISTTNPDRFETFFRYKRSGFVRQSATSAEAGFNFGSLTT
jgi:phage tail sheath gpL-like